VNFRTRTLVEGLASTELARRGFFRAHSRQRDQSQPRLTARLHSSVRFGLVKVIIIANFDPLIERALADENPSRK